MAITKAKKGEIVEKLEKALKGAKSLVFVNFHGLKVSDTTALRRALRSEGVEYAVTKKSLTKRVLASEKFEGTQPELTGELAMAWSEDLIAPARGIYAYQKKFPEAMKILGGVFEGKYMTKAEMEGIATIPETPVLRGMFVNIVNSPIQRFVISLSKIAETKTSA
jgi:large subunit ribosomal protein L10